MRKILSILVPLAATVALQTCQNVIEERGIISYYDFDSLMQSQRQTLLKMNPTLTIKAGLNGKRESKSERLDSTIWDEEFSDFYDLSLNQPKYANAFDVEVETGALKLKKSTSDRTELQYLMLRFDTEGRISSFHGLLKSTTVIYSNVRNLEMKFENGLMKQYAIIGYQKMIFTDTVFFEIQGNIGFHSEGS